jgi:ATP-dependent Clp protease ATP-binding subunit ClpC
VAIVATVFERFTEAARQVVVLAQEEARSLGHDYIGTEHLLLGLLREEDGLAARVLESLGLTVVEVRAEVARTVGESGHVAAGQMPFTPRAKKVLELALREAISLGHENIDTEHVLLGIVREGEGVACRILLERGADAEKIRTEVIALLGGGEQRQRRGAIRLSTARTGWEYHVLELDRLGEGSTEELNRLGREGWELVAVVGHGPFGLVFKRHAT